MDFGKLAKQAQKAIDKRGGTDALKKDLGELEDIATGPGTAQEKAKRARRRAQAAGRRRSRARGTGHVTAGGRPRGRSERAGPALTRA